MNREIHVRFWEGLGVQFPRATHFLGRCYTEFESSALPSN